MAAPNIVSVTAIYGKTAVQSITTSATAIVENTAGSGKVIKVNFLSIANINGLAPADVTIDLYRSSTAYRLASTLTVPNDTSLDFLNKALYLEEGDTLRLTASANSYLEAVCSYEEIS